MDLLSQFYINKKDNQGNKDKDLSNRKFNVQSNKIILIYKNWLVQEWPWKKRKICSLLIKCKLKKFKKPMITEDGLKSETREEDKEGKETKMVPHMLCKFEMNQLLVKSSMIQQNSIDRHKDLPNPLKQENLPKLNQSLKMLKTNYSLDLKKIQEKINHFLIS